MEKYCCKSDIFCKIVFQWPANVIFSQLVLTNFVETNYLHGFSINATSEKKRIHFLMIETNMVDVGTLFMKKTLKLLKIYLK